MFKAFLKKVEATTDKIASTIKAQDVGSIGAGMSKPLDTIKDVITQIPVAESLKKIDIDTTALTNPIQNIQSALSPSPSYVPLPEHYKEGINLLPSASIIRKYQNQFVEIHNNNINLTQKAEVVDRKIPVIVKICTQQNEAWKKLESELDKLPEVSANISSIRAQIDTILVKIDEIEVLLGTQMENYIANENTKWKEKMQADTSKYKIQKQRELVAIEEDLNIQKVKYEREQAAKEKSRLVEEEKLRRKKEEEEAKARRKKEEEMLREKKLKDAEELQEKRRKEAEELQEKRRKDAEEKSRLEKAAQHQEKLRNALDSAFQQQVADYKNFGPVPVEPPIPVTPIEHIEIPEGEEALRIFFEGSNTEEPITTEENSSQAVVIDEPETSLQIDAPLETNGSAHNGNEHNGDESVPIPIITTEENSKIETETDV